MIRWYSRILWTWNELQVVVLKHIPNESDSGYYGRASPRNVAKKWRGAEVASSAGGDQQRGWSDTSKTPETKKSQTKKSLTSLKFNSSPPEKLSGPNRKVYSLPTTCFFFFGGAMLNFGGVLRAELNPWINRWCVEIGSSPFSSTEKMDINITIVHFEFVYLERPRIFWMMQSSKKCLDLKKFGQIILGVPWDPWHPMGGFRPRSVVQDKARGTYPPYS